MKLAEMGGIQDYLGDKTILLGSVRVHESLLFPKAAEESR